VAVAERVAESAIAPAALPNIAAPATRRADQLTAWSENSLIPSAAVARPPTAVPRAGAPPTLANGYGQ
jgi:hypothetical protein